MKLSFCSELFKTPIEETIRAIARAGFDGIEIAPFNLAASVEEVTPERRVAIRRVAEECGIEIVGLHWLLVSPAGLHITTPDDALRRRSWDYVETLAHLCADLGGKVMILGSPKQRNLVAGDSKAAALARLVPEIRRIAPALSRRNVRLLLEPLDSGQTDVLSTVEETVELAARVEHPQVGWMLDTRAMSHMAGGPLPLIAGFGQGAGHYHANNPDGKGPGMSAFDFRPIFAALREARYLGWVSVEPFDDQPDAPTVCRTALQTLRAAGARPS